MSKLYSSPARVRLIVYIITHGACIIVTTIIQYIHLLIHIILLRSAILQGDVHQYVRKYNSWCHLCLFGSGTYRGVCLST